MKPVEITPAFIKRLEILEAQYPTATDFATAMGVDSSAVRHWKNGNRKFISQTAYNLFERIEAEKLKRR